MSRRREALVGRFRAAAVERLGRVRAALSEAAKAPSLVGLEGALGELHTIKGESKMLGLAATSRFTHALEQGLAGEDAANQATLRGAERAALLLERAMRGQIDAEDVLGEAAADLESGGLTSFDEARWVTDRGAERADGSDDRARWTRVEAARIDRLCDLAGEVGWLIDRLSAELRQVPLEAGAARRELIERAERIAPKMRELEEASWALRLVPVEPELALLAQHGREIAETSGKRVHVAVESGGVELERQVLDALAEPLLHLVRNAVDHGIEAPDARGDKPEVATVRIVASASGASVKILVEDDGRGIAAEALRDASVERGLVGPEAAASLSEEAALQLIFEPGFSTRRVVSEISGRGVGLDVVRRSIEAIAGTVVVDSFEGAGTRFEIEVPASVTRERYVVVEVGEARYGIPARMVRRITRRDASEEKLVAGGKIARDGDEQAPLRELALDLGEPASGEGGLILWLGTQLGEHAWAVPAVLGERELIRRALDPILATGGLVSGSSLLEDGRLVLLLRVGEVLRRSRAEAAPARRDAPTGARPKVLVVDDSPIIRSLLEELLTDAGLSVETAADGEEALARIDRGGLDLIVTDLEMPRLDGFGLVRGVRGRDARLPVIVVSTRGSDEDRRRASELGADAYIVKTGFEGPALLEAVGRFVEITPS